MFKDTPEGQTHGACRNRIAKEGGKSKCCDCHRHEDCNRREKLSEMSCLCGTNMSCPIHINELPNTGTLVTFSTQPELDRQKKIEELIERWAEILDAVRSEVVSKILRAFAKEINQL